MAYVFDNFQGHRKFSGNMWKQDKLILTASENHPKGGIAYQQFVFEKLSETTLKMSFETNLDARTWRLVDQLIFNKTE